MPRPLDTAHANGAPRTEPGLVSIMMPVFNAARYLGDAIESAIAQRYTSWELVIVDDGSTDDSFAIACAAKDPRIRVLRQPNRGEAAARNVALADIHGEYLAFLDADDLYLPDHLEVAIDCLKSNQGIAGVFTDGFHITEDGQRLRTLSSRRRPPRTGMVFDEIVFGSDFLGPPLCVVLRRDIVERQHLRFDEDIVMGPDWDFFVRFSVHGPFQYVARPTCLYRVHRKSITTTLDSTARLHERAKCRMRAIRLPEFDGCPVDVRFNAFYDLLVVALRDDPVRQERIIEWPEFQALPAGERCRLLRLMAGEGILLGYDAALVRRWLRQARRTNPRDLKTMAVASLFAAHRGACGALLRARRNGASHPIDRPPFADLGIE